MGRMVLAALLFATLAAPAAADRAEEDLAAVRKAVGSSEEARARRAEEPASGPEVRPQRDEHREQTLRRHRREPRWFRIRIVERGHERATVSLNLPLALVRTVGDDWPVRGCRRCDSRRTTLGDILRALDSGEHLVEIEDDDASVRVWVE